ncbi:CBS domain containing membrane protein [Rhodobacter ferrooxidans]|uniref:CBS domain containing membrane protein n=2 Tax=Rhodobacter ferrooxidans TaxID=371731 RepID=C8RY62_9RHOB|nr:CBS domain containing membrane protein [Rhodobacter sp. SW2]
MSRPAPREAVRAAIGCGLALVFCGGLLLWAYPHDPGGFVLIAPLGATAFLLIAVPNSPLAQPWSALVGNTLAGLIGAGVVHLALPVPLAAGLAVGLSVLAMALSRAMHPPAGAVALLAVLNAPFTLQLGLGFALVPVALDTALLIGFAVAWNHATGRVYPFRLPPATSPHATADAAPERRLLPPPDHLETLLAQMNLGANIGVEDFSRLLVAAEADAATQRLGGLTCGAVMSRDLITVGADASLRQAAALFRQHGLKTLPVTGDAVLLGMLSLIDVIPPADPADPVRLHMSTDVQPVSPLAPVATLIRQLADSGQQAAPVVEAGRLAGLITRSDLIAVLARQGLGGTLTD